MIHRDGQVVLSGDLLLEVDGTSRVSDWFYPETGYFTQARFDPSGVEIRGATAMHVSALAAGPYGGTYAILPKGLLALSDKGKKLWEFETEPMDFQPVVATDGTAYIVTKKMELVAVLPDGKKGWSFSGIGQPGTPLLGASGTIYFPVSNKLYAIDPSGREKWEALLDSDVWGSITLSSDGTLYEASQKGTLYAFPVGEGLMASRGRNSKEMSETRARRESNNYWSFLAVRAASGRALAERRRSCYNALARLRFATPIQAAGSQLPRR